MIEEFEKHLRETIDSEIFLFQLDKNIIEWKLYNKNWVFNYKLESDLPNVLIYIEDQIKRVLILEGLKSLKEKNETDHN